MSMPQSSPTRVLATMGRRRERSRNAASNTMAVQAPNRASKPFSSPSGFMRLPDFDELAILARRVGIVLEAEQVEYLGVVAECQELERFGVPSLRLAASLVVHARPHLCHGERFTQHLWREAGLACDDARAAAAGLHDEVDPPHAHVEDAALASLTRRGRVIVVQGVVQARRDRQLARAQPLGR